MPEAPLLEPVGHGTLDKMIRLALSDPDDELWRYTIAAGDRQIVGKKIAKLAVDFARRAQRG